jgi:uncharacterized protein
MNFPFLHVASRRSLRRCLLLASCTLLPFAACRTEDPRPGLGHTGGTTSTSSDSGDAGAQNASGGVDFGVGSGGRGVEGGLAGEGGGGTGSGTSNGTGGDENPGTTPGTVCGEARVLEGEFSKKLLLQSAGACSAYQACLFSEAAFELGRQVTLYADDPTDERLEAARAAWIDALVVWSEVVPAQFGPVASVTKDSYHGRGIGAFIHVWPAPNRCEVEKRVISRAYESGYDGIIASGRGLSALEYLLFYEGNDTVCSANSSTAKKWAELSLAELAQAKRDYAKSLVSDVYLKAEELVNVWAEDGEDFTLTLASHEGYGSEQEALNVVAWSLLYPYAYVRDIEVGPLAGIGTADPNPLSEYARVDTESIVANMQAFRALFQGCGQDGAGIGFDDWLVAAGAGTLAEDILAALDDIDAHAATLPPLHTASTQEMAVFYAELKVLSDLLKTQFFGSGSLLNLKLPAGTASDTD